jgi:hypothetical protein
MSSWRFSRRPTRSSTGTIGISAHCACFAWLCARTRRSLSAGLEHARQAVKQAPENAHYRDTLAETLFQSGRRDEAVAEMKQCIQLDPVRPYYRRQLKRMQEAAPATEPPLLD